MTETVAPPHPFDAAVGLTPLTAGLSTGETNPAYNNMVGPFGGVTAATLLESVLKHPPERLGDPLSLTVNFAGPITEGASRSPPGRCAPTARRNTGPSNFLRTEPSPLPRRQCSVPGVKPGRRPKSRCRRFRRPKTLRCCRSPRVHRLGTELRDALCRRCNPPDLESGEHPDSTTTLWVRDRPARALDFTSLTALCDVFFPRVFLRRGKMAPAGTVSMTIYFHADAQTLTEQADNSVLGTARTQRFGNGYFDQSAEIWGSDGALLATTHQLVYFKD